MKNMFRCMTLCVLLLAPPPANGGQAGPLVLRFNYEQGARYRILT